MNINRIIELFIKTSTMNLVMERSVAFWNNENLVVCFVEALSHLTEGLNRGDIRDVFFPEVRSISNNYVQWWWIYFPQANLLDRIKKKQVITDVSRHLQKKLRTYQQSGNIIDIFNWLFFWKFLMFKSHKRIKKY